MNERAWRPEDRASTAPRSRALKPRSNRKAERVVLPAAVGTEDGAFGSKCSFTIWRLLVAESGHGIEARGSARGQVAGGEANGGEDDHS